eukprot:gb/GFBE01060716.1/.p1 GENE.gb/GFBE01060716.1/~~gb/GFBE01060716.1/.p1  ORF type:complete len:115 (+),score=27.68 gb/GFBE01060716.1/:1-345(+)
MGCGASSAVEPMLHDEMLSVVAEAKVPSTRLADGAKQEEEKEEEEQEEEQEKEEVQSTGKHLRTILKKDVTNTSPCPTSPQVSESREMRSTMDRRRSGPIQAILRKSLLAFRSV